MQSGSGADKEERGNIFGVGYQPLEAVGKFKHMDIMLDKLYNKCMEIYPKTSKQKEVLGNFQKILGREGEYVKTSVLF